MRDRWVGRAMVMLAFGALACSRPSPPPHRPLRTGADKSGYSRIEEGLYQGGEVKKPPPETRAVLNLCELEDEYSAEVYLWQPIPDGPKAPTMAWLEKQVAFVE